MSCNKITSQLNTQLEDLEKNRGVMNILKTSMSSNPLLNYLATNIIENQPVEVPPTTPEDLISKLENQVGNTLGLVQTLLSGFLSLPGNFLDSYYFYLLQNQFIPWLIKRKEIVFKISTCLTSIDSLSRQNFYFRLSPSSSKEYGTLMMYLQGASDALTQIPYLETTVRDENGNIISRGYQLPNSIPTHFAIGIDNFENVKHIPVFYFTMRAYALLEAGQNFLRNTISTRRLSEYETQLQEQLKQFLELNGTLLSELSTLIPMPLGEVLSSLDFVKTIREPFGKTALKVLGISSEDTLVLLNGRIGILKSMLKSFESVAESFTSQVGQSIQREMATYHNVELDKLIEDIKGKEYPANLFDFYLKAPAWYSRIEVIKYSLFFFNFAEFTSANYGMSYPYKEYNQSVKALLDLPDQGKVFEQALINAFPEIVKMLYIGNFIASERKSFSLEYLLQLSQNSIAQDDAMISIIYNMQPPPNYGLFAQALKSGLNLLQSTSSLGPAANLVVEGLQTGLFLAIPSLVGLNSQTAITTALSSIESLHQIIPGIEEFSSFLDYLSGGFDFEQCDTLKDKNLFLNPYTGNPTGEDVVDGIADAYKELWTSINGRMEE